MYYLKQKFFLTIIFSSFLITGTADELYSENKFEIKASEKLEWYQLENKIIAIGNAEVASSIFSINAYEIIGFYEGQIGKGKIQNLIANKNATFETQQIIINSNYMNYNIAEETLLVEGDNITMFSNFGNIYCQKKLFYSKEDKKILIDGNVLITLKRPESEINANKLVIAIDENNNIVHFKATDMVKVKLDNFKQNISSDQAEFFNLKQKVIFEGNVIIKQNDSLLKGDKAIIDFQKGISSITSNKQNSVTGVLY